MGKVVKGVYQSGQYGEAKKTTSPVSMFSGSTGTSVRAETPEGTYIAYGTGAGLPAVHTFEPATTAPATETREEAEKPIFSETSLYESRTSFPVTPVKEFRDTEGRVKGFESPIEQKSYYAGKGRYYEEAEVKQYEREASAAKAQASAAVSKGGQDGYSGIDMRGTGGSAFDLDSGQDNQKSLFPFQKGFDTRTESKILEFKETVAWLAEEREKTGKKNLLLTTEVYAGYYGLRAFKGFTTPIMHPIQTAKGLLTMVTHPIATGKSLIAEIKREPAGTFIEMGGSMLFFKTASAGISKAKSTIFPKKQIKFDITQEIAQRRIVGKQAATKANINIIASTAKGQYLVRGKGKSLSYLGEKSSVDFGKIQYQITKVSGKGKTIKASQQFVGTTKYTPETFVSSSILKNAPKKYGFDVVAGYKMLEIQGLPKYKVIGYTESVTRLSKGNIIQVKPSNIRVGYSTVIGQIETSSMTKQMLSYSAISTPPKNVIPDIKIAAQAKGNLPSASLTDVGKGLVSKSPVTGMATAQLSRAMQTSAATKILQLETKSAKVFPIFSIQKPTSVAVTKTTSMQKVVQKQRTFQIVTPKTTSMQDLFPVQKTMQFQQFVPAQKSIQVQKTYQMQDIFPVQKTAAVQKTFPIQEAFTIQRTAGITRQKYTPRPPIPMNFKAPKYTKFVLPSFGMKTISSGKPFYIKSKFLPKYAANLEAIVFGKKRTGRTPRRFTGLELRGL